MSWTTAREPASQSGPPPRKTLLVVDDDSDVRDVLAGGPGRRRVRRVCVEHGEEALAYLHVGPPPDAILLDLFMPVMSGWDFARHVRKYPEPGGHPDRRDHLQRALLGLPGPARAAQAAGPGQAAGDRTRTCSRPFGRTPSSRQRRRRLAPDAPRPASPDGYRTDTAFPTFRRRSRVARRRPHGALAPGARAAHRPAAGRSERRGDIFKRWTSRRSNGWYSRCCSKRATL